MLNRELFYAQQIRDLQPLTNKPPSINRKLTFLPATALFSSLLSSYIIPVFASTRDIWQNDRTYSDLLSLSLIGLLDTGHLCSRCLKEKGPKNRCITHGKYIIVFIICSNYWTNLLCPRTFLCTENKMIDTNC